MLLYNTKLQECNCRSGWGGVLCDEELNYCEKNPNTCENGGKCTSLTKDDGFYTCECPAGYRGEKCDRNTMTTSTSTTTVATATVSSSTSYIETITPMSHYNNSVEPLLSARNTTISTVDTTTAVTTSSTEYNDDDNET